MEVSNALPLKYSARAFRRSIKIGKKMEYGCAARRDPGHLNAAQFLIDKRSQFLCGVRSGI